MAYDVNVSDPIVRMNDSVPKFEIRLVANGFLEPFPALGLIVWMESLKKGFESRWRPMRVETQHTVTLLRPVRDITSSRVPGPTASLAQPLRFRQICFALTQ